MFSIRVGEKYSINAGDIMQSFTFTGPYGDIECLVHACAREGAPVLIMSHGFRGSREGGGKAPLVAQRVAEYAAVVRFNFNGSQILSRQVEELQAVIAAVRKRLPDRKIFLLGRSFGGAASIITAAADKNICGLVLWSCPHDLQKTFRNVLGQELYERLDSGEVLQLEDERGKMELPPTFLQDIKQYALGDLLRQFTLPVLILHGKKDEVVNYEQAEDNYRVLQSEKELHIFAEGDHSLGMYSDEAAEKISLWIQKFA